jgi:hypothetical protein
LSKTSITGTREAIDPLKTRSSQCFPMLRRLAFSISTSCRFRATLPAAPWTRLIQTGGGNAVKLPNPPPLSALTDEHDNVLASTWTKAFAATNGRIPRELVELSFSRSSGPGGQVGFEPIRMFPALANCILQNVNKVNTKATLRCSLNQPWIPRWAVPILVKDVRCGLLICDN